MIVKITVKINVNIINALNNVLKFVTLNLVINNVKKYYLVNINVKVYIIIIFNNYSFLKIIFKYIFYQCNLCTISQIFEKKKLFFIFLSKKKIIYH